MIRVLLDRAGTIQAVEDPVGRRGVVRGPMSQNRFLRAVNEEFPEVLFEVDKR